MTPEEEHIEQMLKLIESLTKLVQKQDRMIHNITVLLQEVQAHNEALPAIGKAKS